MSLYKWCPKGCGKKVVYERPNVYRCEKCFEPFEVEDLAICNNMREFLERRKNKKWN